MATVEEEYLDRRFPTLKEVFELIEDEDDRIARLREDSEAQERLSREAAIKAANLAAAARESAIKSFLDDDTADIIDDEEVSVKINQIRAMKSLKEALMLTSSIDQIGADIAKAGKIETQLKRIAVKSSDPDVKQVCEQAMEKIDRLWMPVISGECKKFAEALQTSKWPIQDPTDNALKALESSLAVERASYPVLETFKVLAFALEERIKFNFEGDQETARADKPEWLLRYLSKLIDSHKKWLRTRVQPILKQNLPTRHGNGGAVGELVKALQPSFAHALQGYFAAVTENPDLMRHIVMESIAFDTNTSETYLVDCCITAQILNGANSDIFLKSESQRALDGLRAILAQPGSIDFDADCSCAKPTFAAENVKQLLDNATSTLRSDSDELTDLQLRLVQTVHFPVLNDYYESLADALRRYRATKSALARAVGSVSKEDASKVASLEGLEYLGHLYGSSSYITQTLQSAQCDIFFVRLAQLTGNDNGIFDGICKKFRELQAVIGTEMAKLLSREFMMLVSEYLHINWHQTVQASVEPSQELSHVLNQMQPLFLFIDRLCKTTVAGRNMIIIPFVDLSVSDILWRQVVNANRFTPAGGRQLLVDIQYIWTTLGLPTRLVSHDKLVSAALILMGADLDENDQQVLNVEEAENIRRRVVEA